MYLPHFLILMECSLRYRNYIDPKIHFTNSVSTQEEKNHEIPEIIVVNNFQSVNTLILIVLVNSYGCLRMKIKWDGKQSLPKIKPQGKFKNICLRENECLADE